MIRDTVFYLQDVVCVISRLVLCLSDFILFVLAVIQVLGNIGNTGHKQAYLNIDPNDMVTSFF